MKRRKKKYIQFTFKDLLTNPYFWAVALRFLALWIFPHHLRGDAGDYDQIASNLAAGHGFTRCPIEPFTPTAQRPPLYPITLAMVYLLGLSHTVGPALLNLVFDLISMKLLKTWADDLRLSWASSAPWLVALCPLLITYGIFPTTENISISLFIAAVVLSFRHMPVGAGFFWGLLSLCRSYYLIFPMLLFVFPPAKSWKRKTTAIMVVASFLAPGCWMIRNYKDFHKVAFSQTSMVGWQAYQGLCYSNFDWWRDDHTSSLMSHPLFSRMMNTHCSAEEEIAAMDQEAILLVKKCITEQPFTVVRNIFVKFETLLMNWGQIVPYERVPFLVQSLINGTLFFYWLCVVALLRKKKRWTGALGESLKFTLLTIFYTLAITIPFAVDARYLLGPFILMLLLALETAQKPVNLFRSGISPNGDRTP